MKLIATAKTFSEDNMWTEYEIFKHGARYRVTATENGLGGFLSDPEPPTKWWATKEEVKDLLLMDTLGMGTVTVFSDLECDKIL